MRIIGAAAALVFACGLEPAQPARNTALAVNARPLQAVPFAPGSRKLHWKDGVVVLRFSRSVRTPDGGGVHPGEEIATVHAALAAAVRAWTASPYAAVSIDVETTDEEKASLEQNVVTFTDPAPFDDGWCDKQTAAACTLLSFVMETGEIQGATIAFNPYLQFSSTGLANTFDIGAVMLHETGHVLGLDHSGLLNAAMSPFVESLSSSRPPEFVLRELSADDLLTLAETYPAADNPGQLGKLTGTARLNGEALAGGHVIAVAESGIPVRDTLTDAQGGYVFLVEPGNYTLLLEPLDGPITAGRFAQPPGLPDPFPTLFWTAGGGDSRTPDTIAVEAGAGATADFAVSSAEVSNLRRVGIVHSDSTTYVYQVDLPRGGEYLLSAIRDPLTGTPRLWVSGSAIELKDETKPGPDPDLAEQAISIPADAVLGSYNLYYHDETNLAVLAGALRVTLRPVVTAAWIDEDGSGIVISGSDLAGVEAQGDGATQLGGVSVRVGDRFAPLLAVSPGEIRAGIPAGIPPGRAEVTVIASPAARSEPVTVELPEEPGKRARRCCSAARASGESAGSRTSGSLFPGELPGIGQDLFEVLNGSDQALFQGHLRLPAKLLLSQRYVRLALHGIVLGQRTMNNLGSRAGGGNHLLRQFADRELVRITDIDGAGEALGVHQAPDAFDQIRDVAEGTGL